MQIVDANIVLRYLLNDHADLHKRAAEIIESQSVCIPFDFVDALLLGYNHVKRHQVFSFDKGLNKLLLFE